VIDVGEQPANLKRLLHRFDNVTSVIFVVALSDYDLYVKGETGATRLKESLRLFGEVLNSVWLRHIPFILLLNKRDLFEEKIKRQDLSISFPDYKETKEKGLKMVPGRDNDLEFIRLKFLELNRVMPNHTS